MKPRIRQPKSALLAIGQDAVYALTTPTFLRQVEALLESHNMKDATNLVKDQQKKLDDIKKQGLPSQLAMGPQVSVFVLGSFINYS
jgi:hypothetical protein